MSDETNEELEVQEPQNKPKKSIGMSIPLVIGAAVGVLVIIVLGVVLGVVVAGKYFGPPAAEPTKSDDAHKTEQRDSKSMDLEDDLESNEGYLSKLEDILLMETGRITTNPKGAISVFVVVNFGFEFKMMDAKNKALRTLADKDGIVNLEHPIMKKMQARIRGILNKMIGSYTKEELLDIRPTLTDLVRTELRTVFRDYELLLGNVTIQEFIIQD